MELDALLLLSGGLTGLIEWLKNYLRSVKAHFALSDAVYVNVVHTIAVVFGAAIALAGGTETDIIARAGWNSLPQVVGQLTAAFLIVFFNEVFHQIYDRFIRKSEGGRVLPAMSMQQVDAAIYGGADPEFSARQNAERGMG